MYEIDQNQSLTIFFLHLFLRNSDVFEDSGGGIIDKYSQIKSSFNKNKRDVENVELAMSPRVSSFNKISTKTISNFHPKDKHLSRNKREGFFDLSEVPRMMVHAVQGLTHGLPSMLHSMMTHGHQ